MSTQATDDRFTRIKSHADADRLGDQPFIAYCLVQCAKLFIRLIVRRWPELN